LRWLAATGLAIVLAILLMIDWSIRAPAVFFTHLAIGVVVVACVFLTPRLRPLRRLVLNLLFALPLGVLLVVINANLAATRNARGLLYSDVSEVPSARVGLVFGTTDRVQGRENLYFRYRIDAAEKLWKAGKVEILIVSGDNRSDYYNEPKKMREALEERGIPGDRIVADARGLRTLDSVIRVKETFGTDSVLLISQRFQNERAIYVAKANGIRAYGFNARDVGVKAGFKTRLREIGARVKMWLDVHFLNTRPKHRGDRKTLPEPLPDKP